MFDFQKPLKILAASFFKTKQFFSLAGKRIGSGNKFVGNVLMIDQVHEVFTALSSDENDAILRPQCLIVCRHIVSIVWPRPASKQNIFVFFSQYSDFCQTQGPCHFIIYLMNERFVQAFPFFLPSYFFSLHLIC